MCWKCVFVLVYGEDVENVLFMEVFCGIFLLIWWECYVYEV